MEPDGLVDHQPPLNTITTTTAIRRSSAGHWFNGVLIFFTRCRPPPNPTEPTTGRSPVVLASVAAIYFHRPLAGWRNGFFLCLGSSQITAGIKTRPAEGFISSVRFTRACQVEWWNAVQFAAARWFLLFFFLPFFLAAHGHRLQRCGHGQNDALGGAASSGRDYFRRFCAMTFFDEFLPSFLFSLSLSRLPLAGVVLLCDVIMAAALQ